MRNAERHLYRTIIRLHPAAFRDEFGHQMLLDFEDGRSQFGFARLCGDALLSLARQWARCAVCADYDGQSEKRPSLLAGQYVMVRDQRLSALEWSRGLIASTALLAICGYGLGAGARVPAKTGVVYAAIQAAAAGQNEAAASRVFVAGAQQGKKFTEFDVATVREDKTGKVYLSFPMSPDNYYVPTHGYMQMVGLPLGAYIQFAYNMNALQITALTKQMPDWAKSMHYDIEARVEGDPGKDDMRTMMRALLASRFGLVLHPETKIDNVDDLVLKNPAKLGPTLHPHADDDPKCIATVAAAPKDFFSPCGTIGFLPPDPKTRLIRMAGRHISLSQFVWYASIHIDKTVIDKTRLNGTYDFTLEFAPERLGGGPETTAPEPAVGPIFPDAIQDQMGLKLVPSKGPVTTYLLDHIEKPAEN